MSSARLFLVGCPRSGTTLLQSMLAAHSQISSFPESHFLLVTSRSRRGRWMRKLGLVSPEMRQRLHQFLRDAKHPELMPASTIRLSKLLQQFGQILDQITVKAGKSIWLEKTPGHLYYIEDFERAWPDVHFIHLIRNGSDVVASLYQVTNQYPETWGARYTVEECIRMWQRCTELSKIHCTKPNHLWVDYEELVATPSVTLTRICDFIGIGFEPEMITNYANGAEKFIRADERWKHQTYEAITSPESRKFEQIFSPNQQAEILEKLSMKI